jgi:2-polyprenyl-6-methoxyphenol hydroxylase-like FAD-dependent oxidoreductase
MHVVPPPGRRHGNHAVVIGASMGGLLAARVLSAHFDKVTLFDRDSLPAGVENRRGVPQGRHGHGILASGMRGMKALFPDLERELIDGGALRGDVVGSARWFQHGHYKAKFQSGLDALLLSRPFLERTVRHQVEKLPNVTIFDNSRVVGLLADGGRVTGVTVHQPDRDPFAVTADLVVDTGGRGAKSGEWLQSLGFEKPVTDEVHVGIGYTTRLYRRRPTDLGGDVAAIIAPKPPRDKRVGFMLAMEGDRWIVTMGGWLGNHCPIDPDGYLEFSKTLATEDIYEVIRHAEPLTDAVTFGFPANLRRRYEQLARFPENYLVMGDAMCSFNPLYGQGMSVATLEALALHDCLERAASLDGLWRPFFAEAGKIIDGPWTMAVVADFAFEGVTGTKPAGTDLVNWYIGHVHAAAATDRIVCRAFFDVANLLAPATSLFRPSIIGRVLRARMALNGPLTIESDRSITTAHERMIETH